MRDDPTSTLSTSDKCLLHRVVSIRQHEFSIEPQPCIGTRQVTLGHFPLFQLSVTFHSLFQLVSYMFQVWMAVHYDSREEKVFRQIVVELQWGSQTHRGGRSIKWPDTDPSVGCIDCSFLSLDPSQ